MVDRDSLSEKITTEDIINLLEDRYGSRPHKTEKSSGALIFSCVCHNDISKMKLYYYPDTKIFNCYSSCGTMNIFDLIMEVEGITFKQAFDMVCGMKGVSSTGSTKVVGLIKDNKRNHLDEELELLNRHLRKDRVDIKIPTLPYYSNNLMNIFCDVMPDSWKEEGITEEVFQSFNCKFSISENCCLIPHYDINNHLIGIRSRNFSQRQLDSGRKYIPFTIEGMTYRFPSHYNLYGINTNQVAIRRLRKVVIVEGEKGVLQYASMFGIDMNIALATMGRSFSEVQKKIILSMNVEEVIIAYDKQWIDEELENKNSKVYKDFVKHINKIRKIYLMLRDFVNISVILCWDDRLDYKDSPLDKGKQVFTELLDERYFIEDESEFDEIIEY